MQRWPYGKTALYHNFSWLFLGENADRDGEPFQSGGRLYTSESDVYRRQILTYKDGPRTEIVKIFLMAVDP